MANYRIFVLDSLLKNGIGAVPVSIYTGETSGTVAWTNPMGVAEASLLVPITELGVNVPLDIPEVYKYNPNYGSKIVAAIPWSQNVLDGFYEVTVLIDRLLLGLPLPKVLLATGIGLTAVTGLIAYRSIKR